MDRKSYIGYKVRKLKNKMLAFSDKNTYNGKINVLRKGGFFYGE